MYASAFSTDECKGGGIMPTPKIVEDERAPRQTWASLPSHETLTASLPQLNTLDGSFCPASCVCMYARTYVYIPNYRYNPPPPRWYGDLRARTGPTMQPSRRRLLVLTLGIWGDGEMGR